MWLSIYYRYSVNDSYFKRSGLRVDSLNSNFATNECYNILPNMGLTLNIANRTNFRFPIITRSQDTFIYISYV